MYGPCEPSLKGFLQRSNSAVPFLGIEQSNCDGCEKCNRDYSPFLSDLERFFFARNGNLLARSDVPVAQKERR